tara:strand:- start:332 stop:2782 length:2451 start_codon:yes stop_codon:yes gene_type:complete
MTVPGNLSSPLLATAAAAGTGAVATKSLRFNSAYLHRTPSSAGNLRTHTFAAWIKRSSLGGRRTLFRTNTSEMHYSFAESAQGNEDAFFCYGGAGAVYLVSNPVFRDPAAFFHLCVAWDTTQSTSTDRLKLYINGVRQTSWKTGTFPSQNFEGGLNKANKHGLGANSSGGEPFSGYLADVYFIDGSALSPVDNFIELDDNGVYQAKAYNGTFGTNGFHLPFSDSTSTTTIAEDNSGNGNDFTASGISVTAGSGNDSLFDVPTNGSQSDNGAGGEVSGCYATLNPLHAITNNPTNGNLDIGGSSTGTYTKSVSTIFIDPEDTTGYYCEFTVVTVGTNPGGHIQLIPQLNVTNNGKGETGGVGLGMRGSGAGNKWYLLTDQSSGTDTGVAHAANQVIGVAVKNGKLYMAINNTWVLSGNPATESNPIYSSLSGLKGFLCGTLDGSWQCNWGQRAFAYSSPSGYRPVSSAFLPTPTIANGSVYFDSKLYTGDGASASSTQAITGFSFSPDWLWIKSRGVTAGHAIYDTVRASTQRLSSSQTTTFNNEGFFESFDSNGFTVKGDGNNTNANNQNYVAWCWDAGSSTASNTDGSITSSVRASQTAGISIVSWTGTGANATVGHSLNAQPKLLLVKNRDATASWAVWHTAISGGQFLGLNTTNAQQSSANYWNSTVPTTSVFSVGSDSSANGSSNDMVAYCISPVAGYSAVGSYEGNGQSGGSGPFVYLGFRAKFILLKNADLSGSNWFIFDTSRNTYNVVDLNLKPNSNAVEETDSNGTLDILSNGFSMRSSGTHPNGNGNTIIYAAFAENPFQANGGLAR